MNATDCVYAAERYDKRATTYKMRAAFLTVAAETLIKTGKPDTAVIRDVRDSQYWEELAAKYGM